MEQTPEQTVQKFSALYGTRSLVPVVTGPTICPCPVHALSSYYFSTQCNIILLSAPCLLPRSVMWIRIDVIFKCSSNCRSQCCQCWRSLAVLSPADSDHQTSPMTVQYVPRLSYLEGHFITMNDARKRGPVCWMRHEGLRIEIQHGDRCGPWENNSWGYKGGPHVDGRLR
jgi:hypothetical protein